MTAGLDVPSELVDHCDGSGERPMVFLMLLFRVDRKFDLVGLEKYKLKLAWTWKEEQEHLAHAQRPRQTTCSRQNWREGEGEDLRLKGGRK